MVVIVTMQKYRENRHLHESHLYGGHVWEVENRQGDDLHGWEVENIQGDDLYCWEVENRHLEDYAITNTIKFQSYSYSQKHDINRN